MIKNRRQSLFLCMRQFTSFYIDDPDDFRLRFSGWAGKFREACILYSNDYPNKFPRNDTRLFYDLIAGTGALKKFGTRANQLSSLDRFIESNRDWVFGHLGYNLKNEIEELSSIHPDYIKFPGLFFFIPEHVFIIRGNQLEVGWQKEYDSIGNIQDMVVEIKNQQLPEPAIINTGKISAVISKSDYLRAVENIKDHIQKGDIYEVNFCQEFISLTAEIDPLQTWLRLIEESPTPFSCYYRLGDKHLLCASPERFIKKTGSVILSQPIKGTSARGKTIEEDRLAMESLLSDPKERAENIMITDLVRNDLSKIACRGSVKVKDLCRIYPYPRVFQMQSDISARLPQNISFSDIIKATFPMGSMTGAPKIRAMEIIEQYEKSSRGLYSGAVGYISPEEDFDFNVVIRSIQYNQARSALSFMVGGAITSLSTPESEYRECMLKAEAIIKVLGLEPGHPF
jgi:para-aminobenzoate synthetase component I